MRKASETINHNISSKAKTVEVNNLSFGGIVVRGV